MELFFLLLLIVLMAVALGSGYPVAFALPGASILTLILAGMTGWIFTGDAGAFFAQGDAKSWLSSGNANLRGLYWEPERDTLIAIPLFIFMGIMLQRSKIAEDLLLTMANLFGPVRGGLGISVIFVGALLAATTGIVGATVVAMGLISLPAMIKNGYSQSMATGTIAASGTLGQIIPPSIVLIILADQLASAADQASSIRKALHKETTGELAMPSSLDVISTSAGEMFLGAFLPGLVLVGLYMLYILIAAFLRPNIAPAVPYKGKYDTAFAVQVFVSLVPPLLLIFLVLGSIMAGVATVNQAGAIGAAGALIMSGYRLVEGQKNAYYPAILGMISLVAIAVIVSTFDTNIKSIHSASDLLGVVLAIIATLGLVCSLIWSGRRALRIDNTLYGVMVETAKATALVFIILMGAAILTSAFRAFGGEHLVREFLEGLPGGFWTKFIIVMAVIFILGFFLDFIEIAVVVVPIVAPILLADPQANITAVWLGVMIGLNIQTSFLTPPFGFALFYLRGVADRAIKTINMYKGVVPFIILQIIAMVIVASYPPLVNYLPNRISLTSENAPPPRNPKLSQCVDHYIDTRFAAIEGQVMAAHKSALDLDISALPDNLQDDLRDALAALPVAIEKLRMAQDTRAAATAGAVDFAPLHQQVRAIERDIRRLEKHHDGAHSQQIAALRVQFPNHWDDALGTYRALSKARDKAARAYSRAAQDAYIPVAELIAILQAQKAFIAVENSIRALPAQLNARANAEMIEVLKTIEAQLNDIAGVSDIKSAVSKARRAIKKDPPKIDDALALLDKAITQYDAQKPWRMTVTADLLPSLLIYVDALRDTIGLREQAKLTHEQALFVAGCQSHHRDQSLNF